MSLVVTLILESADRSEIFPVEAPKGYVEQRLFALLSVIQDLVDDPLAAQTQYPAIQLAAATSPWPLTRQKQYFEPLLRAGIQKALQGELALAQAAGSELVPLQAGEAYPSIWNPRTKKWDPLDGAAILMQVSLPMALRSDGSGYRMLNDPLLPATLGADLSPKSFDLDRFAPRGLRYLFNLHDDQALGGQVRECTYCFPFEGLGSHQGIVIFFAHTRTQVVSIVPSTSVLQVTGVGPLGGSRESPTWVLSWQPTAERGAEFCVSVRYLGDPPYPTGVSWITAEAASLALPSKPVPGGTLPIPPKTVAPNDVEALAAFELTYAFELAHRESLIQASPKFKQEKRYFLELERATNPLGLIAEDRERILQLGEYLAIRYRVRALYRQDTSVIPGPGSEGDSLPMPEVEKLTWRAHALAVASLMEAQFVQHFPDGKGGIDVLAVGQAYARFGGGELAVFGTHGVPNGLNLFCFVELALVLVQLDWRPELWGRLLRGFGICSEIFVRTFHACGAKRTFCAYSAGNNPQGVRAPGPLELQAIRQGWGSSAPIDRYERLLQSALFDELPMSGGPEPRGFDSIGCEPGLALLPIALRARYRR